MDSSDEKRLVMYRDVLLLEYKVNVLFFKASIVLDQVYFMANLTCAMFLSLNFKLHFFTVFDLQWWKFDKFTGKCRLIVFSFMV